MYLKEVKIKNFRGYGENHSSEDNCYIYSSLDSPLVVFHGFNGFGKTSFYEAVEWCLTDSVYRLNKFYDDETYYANELKKSHYLKFYHPLDGIKKYREVYVELNFDNGLSIIRKSNSSILKTTENDRSYSSTVMMGYNGQLEIVNNENVLNQFITRIDNKETFFNTHMLGQESIGDFLRNNSPSDRRKIFMQLLQEEKLASYIETLKKLKAPNNRISIQFNKFNNEFKKINETKNEISESLTKLGFDNELQYLDIIRQKIKPIFEILKSDIPDIELNSSLLSEKEINLNNISELLENASIVHQNISNRKDVLNSEMSDLQRKYELVKKLSLLDKAKEKLKLEHHAQVLKDNNIGEIQKEILNLSESITKIQDQNTIITQRKNELNKYNALFLNFTKNLNDIDKTINTSFWSNYIEDKIKLSEFNEKFSKILSLLDNDYALVKPYTDNELTAFKIQEQRFQNERKILSDELDNCRETKKELSNLNTEYQNSLKVVKEYIATNVKDITECPVCLNSNFSNDRYKELNVQWSVETNVATKLISIIDLTSAKGNKQIENISKKETEILSKIKELENDFEIKVLNTLKLNLEALSTIFIKHHKFILDELESKNLSLIKEKEEKNARKSELEGEVVSLNQSFKILFGNLENFKQVEKNDIEKYIVDYKDWIQKNHNKMGFLQKPNLSEIQTEINSLKLQLNRGEKLDEGSLLNSIEDKKKSKEFTNKLNELLVEVLKYKIPIKFSRSLGEFSELDKKIKEVKVNIDFTEKAKSFVDTHYDIFFEKQQKIIKQHLENHPIISWVYEAINPHPFHKKLHITNTDRGTNFTGRTQLDDKVDLYLDQIFSAAQLNILALSIFLGLGLTQNYSELGQLFLDDPIQSMDDVNILAFIDVLRAIMDSSKYQHKRLIISTHDDNFAQLLSIKMRNKKIVQYHIVGYTEEGPIIKQV